MGNYTILTGGFSIPTSTQVGEFSFNVYGGNMSYDKQQAVIISNLNISHVDPTIWDLSGEVKEPLFLQVYGDNAFITTLPFTIKLIKDGITILPKSDESFITTVNMLHASFYPPSNNISSGIYNVEITQRLPCKKDADINEIITLENAVNIITEE